MEIIDVSMTLGNDMAIYEGDTKVRVDRVRELPKDDMMLSKITMGLHAGTHVDAPAHFIEGGEKLEDMRLSSLIGGARVCDLTSVDEAVTGADLEGCGVVEGEIILLKTRNSELLKTNEFNKDFVHLANDAADYLVEKKIKAVGIDYLSIEKYGVKEHYVHKHLLSNGIPVIEGLDLRKVSEGLYTLYCLPLKIEGAEGAPARCILIR